MDINRAVDAITSFLDTYAQKNPAFAPAEAQVRPSGDAMDTIKIWINYGDSLPADADPQALTRAFVDAVKAAHPDVAAFTFETRSDAF